MLSYTLGWVYSTAFEEYFLRESQAMNVPALVLEILNLPCGICNSRRQEGELFDRSSSGYSSNL